MECDIAYDQIDDCVG